MKVTLKRKIVVLGVLAATLPVVVMILLITQFQGQVSKAASRELNSMATMNLSQIARDVYGLCETSNDLIQQKMNHDLIVAHEVLKQHKSSELSRDTVSWDAVNQLSKQEQKITLPKFMLGGKWLGQNRSMTTSTPVVDDVKRLVGSACT
ncbi:MAG: Cache 3/Cache 2 fusion domain-containing protein, partial [Syntrophales bacterium]|nr:Cache 3/Cache 2 fusion domain-containing protein [Syntrophales bacterium]